jgi:hypothetical protein
MLRLKSFMKAKKKLLEYYLSFYSSTYQRSMHSSELSGLGSEVHSLSSCAESWIEEAD